MKLNPITNHPRIEMIPAGALKSNPDNPYTYNHKQKRAYESQIRRLGSNLPIIIDENNVILVGEARWEAYKALGHTEVPVIYASFMTANDQRAFMIGEARIAELGGWNDEVLQKQLKHLFDSDYDIELTGFTLADLDFSFGEVDASPRPEEVELPDPTAKSVSRLGDLWIIGPHRLYCGNSLEASSYDVLLGPDRAHMVFADGPYNVKIDGHVSGLGKNKHSEFEFASGEMSRPEFTQFQRAVFRHCVMYSVPGSIHYQCMDWRHQREILDAADGVYSDYKQLIVWTKAGNAGMGTFYRSQHELIFVFKSGKAKHTNNFGLGETGRYRTNVWSYPGANTFRKGREKDLADHPTVKPLALVMDAILDCSNRGDLILDPFSGSGTTLSAAHHTGRRGAAIEIDPLYVDTALTRLAQASGLSPIHADGRTFEEVAADRLNDHGDA